MKLKFWHQDGADFYTYSSRQDAENIDVEPVVFTYPKKVGDFDMDGAIAARSWFRAEMADFGFETIQLEI